MVLPGCSFMGTLAQNGEGLEASPASLVPGVCQGSWLGGYLPQKPAESVAHPLISGPGRWLLTLPRTWVLCQPGRAISTRVSSKRLGQRLAVQEALSCLLMGWAALTAPQGLNKAGIVLAPLCFPLPAQDCHSPYPVGLAGRARTPPAEGALALYPPPQKAADRVFWEDGIMSGYRHPSSSAVDCILSSFQMTNETVNIWSHFLPTWYFVWRLLVLVGTPGFGADPYHWPLLAFLLPACLYPFASCCAHTFSSMSARAHHICYFLDYGALSLYSLGCAVSYAAYSVPASWLHSHLCQLFVPIATLNSFLCTGLSCYSRFPELESPGFSKLLRTAAFTYPFLFDNLPLFYRLGLCWGWTPTCGQEALTVSHGYHLLCAGLTGFLFTTRLPERLAPGRFDYVGHSHQLFHICAVLGTHFQLEAVLADMRSRRAWMVVQGPPPGRAGTLGTLGLVLAGNVLIIAAFTSSLPRAPTACSLLQGGPLERGAKAKPQ
ncbi:membrane progestin receptor delta isoform X2 [Erinaceus europaeus]|uniref:Membrane progestin receptor delta isoform X2 n=1 Tax=Erinaceus europaeus TaxID=9365 RepID=A0A1S3WRV7_ERIEU|nr:membrane progestin receptor delta isoform X2 [Erinaceus europaeus]